MVSIWWLVATFFVGGCAGMLIIALMQMSGGLPNTSAPIPDQDLDLDLDLHPTQW
jgi:RsiW-degrading membrane proteinase PrsW (M82 family)